MSRSLEVPEAWCLGVLILVEGFSALLGLIAGYVKFKKVNGYVMPDCIIPGNFGGGGEKYDCDAGLAVVVALSIAIISIVICQVIFFLIGGCHFKCPTSDDPETPESTKKMKVVGFFHLMIFLCVVGCVLLGLGIPRKGKSTPKMCPSIPNSDPTTAYPPSFQEPHSKKVCPTAAAPAIGGLVVFLHIIISTLYYGYADKNNPSPPR
ncbi:unnamed protein product [Cuscuta epithymum]|uniref:Uncharacterized protein n=1 Tax=Cuscuta epithymum TaxID=186058 RepID=A0AAV0CMF7_9ASTE|nr:unnamed protein product [Cuscuta epithymum]